MRIVSILTVIPFLCVGCGGGDAGTGGDPVMSTSELTEFRQRQERVLSKFDLEPYVADLDKLDRTGSHDRYFEPVGILRLSNDVVVGSVTSLDLSRDGRILIADRSAREAFLFAPNGQFLGRLDPAACDPGYDFRPFSAAFTPDGSILVRNASRPNIVEFDRDGACLQIHDIPVYGPGGITRGANGVVYALQMSPVSYEILSFDSSRASESIHAGTEFSQYNSRMGGLTSSLLVLSGGNLVFMQRQDPLVTLIDSETGDARRVGRKPEDYRPIEEDLKDGLTGTEEIFDDIRRISDGKSVTIGIDEIAENVIAVTYKNSWEDGQESVKSTGLQLVHTSGAVLNAEPIHFRFYLSGNTAGRDGVVIREGSRYEEPSLTMDDNRPLIVYRLNL